MDWLPPVIGTCQRGFHPIQMPAHGPHHRVWPLKARAACQPGMRFLLVTSQLSVYNRLQTNDKTTSQMPRGPPWSQTTAPSQIRPNTEPQNQQKAVAYRHVSLHRDDPTCLRRVRSTPVFCTFDESCHWFLLNRLTRT